MSRIEGSKPMTWNTLVGCIVLLNFLLVIETAFAIEDKAFSESVVIFNTVCAKCHEAECSGRLSFDDAFEKSTSHILRHYGQASGRQRLQKELFDILNYMKERCAYYPMQPPVPLKRIWEGEILDTFTTLMERNYFIPLGHFQPGHYRIELELEKDVKVTAHLISEDFEWLIEDCYQSSDSRISISFLIEDSGDYYFRMYPRNPVKIARLLITADKQSNVQQ